MWRLELNLDISPPDNRGQKLNKTSLIRMVSLRYGTKLTETACDLRTSYLAFTLKCRVNASKHDAILG